MTGRSLPFSVLTWIENYPRAAFWAFAGLHVVVWTALPTAIYPNLPLDLIEAMTYGREWQLGYDKLPPIPWWVIEILRIVIGHDFAYYAFAQVTVIAAFAIVWAMARSLVGPLGALVAIFVIDGLHYFNFTAAKFNHDVVQLPFWALAGYAFWSALRGGKIVWWLVLGASLGLAFWAKYFVIILAVTLALFLLLDRDARPALKTPGPWLAAVVALAVVAPHLVWLVQNDFLPFTYANARAAPSRGLIDHFRHPLLFILSQFLVMAPMAFIASPLFVEWRLRPLRDMIDDFDNRIVTLLAFGPAATVLVFSAITGRGLIPMWGYPLWLFLGLWMVILARQGLALFQRITAAWGIVQICLIITFVADYLAAPYFFTRIFRASNYPGHALAQEISQRYQAKTGRPLAYVIGTLWDGGNIGHYAPERPRVLIDGKPERAPWIDLADLRAKGAVVIWTGQEPKTMPPPFRAIAKNAQIQEGIQLRFLGTENRRVEQFGWAIVPPER
ncbi:MAG: glycosyltransferase family 39 protein [Rhizobiales bacterium]|nr:glycosyltransferase family 39 protein [Hyphomicrobiales bacterium]